MSCLSGEGSKQRSFAQQQKKKFSTRYRAVNDTLERMEKGGIEEFGDESERD